MVLGAVAMVIACRPSPEPPHFPFVSWDEPMEACADPVAAELTVELACTGITGAVMYAGSHSENA